MTERNPARKGYATRVRVSVGMKIAFIIGAVILPLAVVVVGMAASQARDGTLRELDAKGEVIARNLASSGDQLMAAGTLGRLVSDFGEIDGVRYVAVVGPDGEVIQHSLSSSFPRALRVALDPAAPGVPGAPSDVGDVRDYSYPLQGGLGVVHVGMDLGVADSAVIAAVLRIGAVFLIFLVLGPVFASLFVRRVVRPLGQLSSVLERVSTGDLGVTALVETRDELGVLGGRTNAMLDSLRDIVTRVRGAGIRVNEASTEILATSQQQESGMVEQSSSLEEISRSMDSLADTAGAISDNAESMRRLGEEMSGNVHSGQEALISTMKNMSRIVDTNDRVVDRINKLYEQSQAIIRVIDIIDDISDRLDLLALNAALEGARAGEVGKGFSLVAQEMRRLAENVTDSTKEIKGTISKIHQYTEACIDASREGKETTTAGAVEMEKTVKVMEQIFALIGRTNDASQEINVIAEQQLSSSREMAAAMKEIAVVSHESHQAAQEVTSAASELADLSTRLIERVALFRLAPEEVAGGDGGEGNGNGAGRAAAWAPSDKDSTAAAAMS